MQFVQQYSQLGYGYKGVIDEFRATQFPQLKGVTYLDHAAATLYSLQQLSNATQELSQHLFANPHSQLGSDTDHTSSAIDELRSLTLHMLKAPPEEYEVSHPGSSEHLIRHVITSAGEGAPHSHPHPPPNDSYCQFLPGCCCNQPGIALYWLLCHL
jgi:selenocysteine lyase/cysteine desulfurase